MSKKQTTKEPLFTKRHIEIKTFEYKGIDVSVKIDFDMEQISIVENVGSNQHPNWMPKKWNFSCRELRYMQGWQDIMDAMKNAVRIATEDLKGYIKVRDSYDALVESIAAHKEKSHD